MRHKYNLDCAAVIFAACNQTFMTLEIGVGGWGHVCLCGCLSESSDRVQYKWGKCFADTSIATLLNFDISLPSLFFNEIFLPSSFLPSFFPSLFSYTFLFFCSKVCPDLSDCSCYWTLSGRCWHFRLRFHILFSPLFPF